MPEIITGPLTTPYAEGFVHARLAFRDLFLRLGGDKDQKPLDINVSGIYRTEDPKFDSYEEVREQYEALAEAASDDEPDYEDIERRRRADIALSQAYANQARGEEIDPSKLIEEALGIDIEAARPTPARKELLKKELAAILGEVGLKYDVASAQEFRKRYELTEASEIRRQILQARRLSRLALSYYASPLAEEGIVLPPRLVFPSFVNDPTIYWTNYFSTDNEGHPYELANIHPNRTRTPGKNLSDTFHEDAHNVQTYNVKLQIAEGRMSPAAGTVGMHSPETTQFETLAAYIQSLLPEVIGPRQKHHWMARLQKPYNEIVDLVYHEALIHTNQAKPVAEVAARMFEDLPLEKESRLVGAAETLRDSIVYNVNQAHYWVAQENAHILHTMNTWDQRRRAVALLCGPFLSHIEINERLTEIANTE